MDSIRSRMDIRKAIEAGDIARAITHVNELDPHILQNNPELFCHLLQLQLIELIKTGCTREALAFAQHTLAPYASTSGRFLGEMEKIMSLLAFSATGVQASPVGYLLHPIQRTRMANALNEAILKSQCSSSETKLSFVLKRLLWEQRELCKHVDFPHIKRKDFHHAPSVLLASSPPTSSPAAPKSKKHRCKYRR